MSYNQSIESQDCTCKIHCTYIHVVKSSGGKLGNKDFNM